MSLDRSQAKISPGKDCSRTLISVSIDTVVISLGVTLTSPTLALPSTNKLPPPGLPRAVGRICPNSCNPPPSQHTQVSDATYVNPTHVSSHHPDPRLQALQRQILLHGASLDLEPGLKPNGADDKVLLGLVDVVNVEVDVIAANGLGQVLCALTGLAGALLLHAHVDCGEDLVAEFLGRLGEDALAVVFGDSLDILDDLGVPFLDGLHDDAAHGVDND